LTVWTPDSELIVWAIGSGLFATGSLVDIGFSALGCVSLRIRLDPPDFSFPDPSKMADL